MKEETARIAWLPAGRENTASSRLRAFLPCRYLRRSGWRSEIFDPARAGGYALVVFQKRYDDSSLELARNLQSRGTRVVFDLCDNHFHYELDRPESAEKRSRQLAAMIEAADLVTVSTAALGEVVRERTGVVPAVVDDMVEPDLLRPLYRLWGRLAVRRGARPAVRLVWFGSAGMEHPPFGLIDLRRILPLLEELGDEMPLSLTVISNSRPLADRHLAGSRVKVVYREWSRRRFPWVFAPHHIAVIPVNRNPLTVCKTTNRPVLSLLLGVPVVADAIPSYEELADVIVLADWRRGLLDYARDRRLRRRHVATGVKLIREKYDPRRVLSQWTASFEQLLS